MVFRVLQIYIYFDTLYTMKKLKVDTDAVGAVCDSLAEEYDGRVDMTNISALSEKSIVAAKDFAKKNNINKKYVGELSIMAIRKLIDVCVTDINMNYALNKTVDTVMPIVLKLANKSISKLRGACCST
jgi:hypothetical protein